jgi:DNA polymerase-3 subunit delta'
MVFAGPSGVGKRTLALMVAQYLNCLSETGAKPCDACPQCRKILSGAHPDVRLIQPDGAFIRIEQIRAMIGEIAYQPFEGRYRVMILDPAEQMKVETANCMLKTLEEPASRSVMILVTTNPYILLETIRSRARMLLFGGIPAEQIVDHLIRKHGRSPAEARLAAALNNGSLGAALEFDAQEYLKVRDEALRFVSILLRRSSFAAASTAVSAVAKNKESFPVWLEATTGLLRDVYFAQVAPERIVQADIRDDLKKLAREVSHERVIAAIEAGKQLRTGLLHNVNRQIALEALFLSI